MTNQHQDTPSASPDTTRSSARRELLSAALSGAASALLGALAVACGDDDSPARPSLDGSTPTVVGNATGSDGGLAGDMDSGLADASAPSVDAAPAVDAARTPDHDVEPLNALLVNAYSAATAYGACGVLIQSAPPTDAFAGRAAVLRDLTVHFQTHHKAHAQRLSAAVVERGGTPVTEQEVTSKFKAPDALRKNPTITNVLKYVAGLERAAALACNRKIGELEAAYYRHLASSIEGVHAQHFSLLLGLLMGTVEAGTQFNAGNASKLVPVAFVHSVDMQPGLDTMPARYFG